MSVRSQTVDKIIPSTVLLFFRESLSAVTEINHSPGNVIEEREFLKI